MAAGMHWLRSRVRWLSDDDTPGEVVDLMQDGSDEELQVSDKIDKGRDGKRSREADRVSDDRSATVSGSKPGSGSGSGSGTASGSGSGSGSGFGFREGGAPVVEDKGSERKKMKVENESGGEVAMGSGLASLGSGEVDVSEEAGDEGNDKRSGEGRATSCNVIASDEPEDASDDCGVVESLVVAGEFPAVHAGLSTAAAVSKEVATDSTFLGAGPEIVAPRSYQLELLALAKKENVVVYLETGAGKTLVAALLLGEILLSLGAQGKKYGIFLVDRTPLVNQQSTYFESVLGPAVKIGQFHREMSVTEWHAALQGKNALFMTAQLFLNALRHGVISLRDVALLIFDEAHHCTKGHPFHAIMKEHYFSALEEERDVPRIFGMSASPVKVKNAGCAIRFCEEQIAILQRNLDAKVVFVTAEGQAEVEDIVPKAEEFVVEYARSESSNEDVGTAVAQIVGERAAGLDSESRRSASEIIEEVGAFAACFIAENESCVDGGVATGSSVRHLSFKSQALIDLLLFERQRWEVLPDAESKFRCIVFMQRRDVAAGLTWLLNQAFGPCNDDCLRARLVVGTRQTTNVPSALRNSPAEQSSTLRDFRSGKFGILIATNVIEEGLDIPSVGLVVMFNSVSSPKAYIQSRGRGRHAKARYVVLLPQQSEGASFERNALREAKKGAEAMEVALKQMKVIDSSGSKLKSSELRLCSFTEPFLASRTTAARVSATAAPQLLKQFCESLPENKNLSVLLSPQYEYFEEVEGCFTCTVILPTSSPVSRAECSDPQVSKVKARRLAALAAYRSLYDHGGLLDEHLFSVAKCAKAAAPVRMCSPSKKKSGRRSIIIRQPEQLQWDRSPNSTSRSVYLYEIVLPGSVFSEPRTAYLNQMRYGSSKYGIILSKELDKADLVAYILPIEKKLFELILIGSFELTTDQDCRLLQYGEAVRNVALGKEVLIDERGLPANDSNSIRGDSVYSFGFHVVPLNEGAGVKWEAVDAILCFDSNRNAWGEAGRVSVPNCYQKGSILPDRSEASDSGLRRGEFSLVRSAHDTKHRLYFAAHFDPERTPKHPCGEFLGGQFDTFEHYYRERHQVQINNVDGPMLAAYSLDSIGGAISRGVFYLVPELCRKLPLSPWSLYYMTIMPHWQTFLSIQAFRRSNRIEGSISLRNLAAALQPRRSQIHCQDISYERFEFLGDTVLKALVSMSVFYNNPTFEEGQLTDSRDLVISNSYLCSASVSIGVGNVISHTGATVKKKSWPFYLGAPQKKKETFSAKVLADCAESLIGIHYLRGGIDMAIPFLELLGVGENMNCMFEAPFRPPGRNDASSKASRSVDPRCLDPRLADVEAIIGYNFRKREVLVEALTHTSYRVGGNPSYQRLEFLGDAVIGLLILEDSFHRYPDLGPDGLTGIREPALSNDLFGRVLVKWGLHKFPWYVSSNVVRDIDIVAKAFEEEADDENICDETIIPKILGDILESIVGAIVVDQDMCLDEAQRVVRHLTADVLDRFANPDALKIKPVIAMTKALQAQRAVAPDFSFQKIHPPEVKNKETLTARCTISAAGNEISSAAGLNSKSAKHRAAQAALDILHPQNDVGDATEPSAKRQCRKSANSAS